jgi:hypothetical protein
VLRLEDLVHGSGGHVMGALERFRCCRKDRWEEWEEAGGKLEVGAEDDGEELGILAGWSSGEEEEGSRLPEENVTMAGGPS